MLGGVNLRFVSIVLRATQVFLVIWLVFRFCLRCQIVWEEFLSPSQTSCWIMAQTHESEAREESFVLTESENSD